MDEPKTEEIKLGRIPRHVSITPEEDKFLRDFNLSPTDLLKEKIRDLQYGTSEQKQQITDIAKVSKKQNLNQNIIIAVVGLIFIFYSMSIKDLILWICIFGIGMLLFIYGFYQLFIELKKRNSPVVQLLEKVLHNVKR